MCDYSLMSLPNRLAVADEKLVSYRFSSGTIGFASPADLEPVLTLHSREPWSLKGIWKRIVGVLDRPPVCAVCIPPGARLLFSNIPEHLQHRWDLQSVETATFIQTSALENTHRDGVMFSNGRQASLQELPPGQKVRVVSLSAVEESSSPRESVHQRL